MNKLMQRLSVVIILAAIVTVGVAGCGFLDRLEAWKYGVEEGKGEAVQEQQNSEETQTQEIGRASCRERV